MTRDPRVEPRKGDMLRCADGSTVTVEGLSVRVGVRTNRGDYVGSSSMSPSAFREMFAADQVIHAEGEHERD